MVSHALVARRARARERHDRHRRRRVASRRDSGFTRFTRLHTHDAYYCRTQVRLGGGERAARRRAFIAVVRQQQLQRRDRGGAVSTPRGVRESHKKTRDNEKYMYRSFAPVSQFVSPGKGFLRSFKRAPAPCALRSCAISSDAARGRQQYAPVCGMCMCAQLGGQRCSAVGARVVRARCTGRAGLGERNSRYLVRFENNTPPFFLRVHEPTQARSSKIRTRAIRQHTKANRNAPNTQETNHAARCSGAFTHPPAEVALLEARALHRP